MARQRGSLELPGNLEPQSNQPLDARELVKTKADLTNASNFPYSWVGMQVFVEAETKWYYLKAKPLTNMANWSEIGSGGGGGGTVLEPSRNAGELLGMKAVDGDKELRVFTDGQVIVIDGAEDKTVNLATQDYADSKAYDDTELEARVTANETAIADRYTKAETDTLLDGEHIELTQAEYDALSEEEKKNGKVYFITDGGAYVPAIDLIPYGNQAPIVVGKLDLRGDGEFRDIKRVRLWINDLKNASGIITAGWTEEGVYVRPIRIYGWFTFHDTVNTPTSWEYRIQQLPIPYSGYKMIEAPSSADTIGLKFYVDHNNKLRMVVDGQSYFNQEDFACVIIDFMETPVA